MYDEFEMSLAAPPEDAASRAAGASHQALAAGEADASPESLGGSEAAFVPRAEFHRVVGQRQAAKEKARQLAAQVEGLLERLRAAPEEAELREFRDWKAQRSAGADGPDGPPVAGGDGGAEADDVGAIEGRVRGPLEQRLAALRAANDAARRRLADLLRDQELRAAAGRAGAINPDQVVALLRDRVRIEAGPDGRVEMRLLDADGQPAGEGDGGGGPPGLQRFVEAFLAAEENANLVRCSVAPGSGARQAGGPGPYVPTVPRTRAEFLALPPEQRLAAAHRMTRQQRDELLGRSAAPGGGYL